MTPVWPLAATLSGATEGGTTITVDDGAPQSAGGDGRFAFATTLAPWPQIVRVVATDAAGNQTMLDVSIVGGIDYRVLPWPAILTVLVLIGVIASGILGTRRRQGPVAASLAGIRLDDGSGPELEDLPPGTGL